MRTPTTLLAAAIALSSPQVQAEKPAPEPTEPGEAAQISPESIVKISLILDQARDLIAKNCPAIQTVAPGSEQSWDHRSLQTGDMHANVDVELWGGQHKDTLAIGKLRGDLAQTPRDEGHRTIFSTHPGTHNLRTLR